MGRMAYSSEQIASNVALLMADAMSRRGNQKLVVTRTGINLRTLQRIQRRLEHGDLDCLSFTAMLRISAVLGIDAPSVIMAANLSCETYQIQVHAQEIRKLADHCLRKA